MKLAYSLICLFLVLLLSNSCKKDVLIQKRQSQALGIFDVKDWYSKQDIATYIQPNWTWLRAGSFGESRTYRAPLSNEAQIILFFNKASMEFENYLIVKTDDSKRDQGSIEAQWYDLEKMSYFKKSLPYGIGAVASHSDDILVKNESGVDYQEIIQWLGIASPKYSKKAIKTLVTARKSSGSSQPHQMDIDPAMLGGDFGGGVPGPCVKIITMEGGEGCDIDEGGSGGGTNWTPPAELVHNYFFAETQMYYSLGSWMDFFYNNPDIAAFYAQNGYMDTDDPSLPPDVKYIMDTYYTEIRLEMNYLHDHPEMLPYGILPHNLFGTAFANITKGIKLYESEFALLANPLNVTDKSYINNGAVVTDPPIIIGAPIKTLASTSNKMNTEDMLSETNGSDAGISPAITNDLLQKTDNELFDLLTLLYNSGTVFGSDLRTVAYIMRDRFQARTGGEFSNSVLTSKVQNSEAMNDFLYGFAGQLNILLKANGGDINLINNFRVKDRPVFGGAYNMSTGLTILINDTEYTKIDLENFTITSPGHWTATVQVTVVDHFGMDRNDTNRLVFRDRFLAWWLLQHRRAYVPFITKATFRTNISSHY